jgi:preprotein translocase subunit YajC
MTSQLALLLFQSLTGGGGMIPLPLMMVGFFAIVYFLMIRPQQQQRKKWTQMIASLKAGDRVTTTGGIVGIIFSVKSEGKDGGTLVLRVAPDNVKLEVARSSIQSISVDDDEKKS